MQNYEAIAMYLVKKAEIALKKLSVKGKKWIISLGVQSKLQQNYRLHNFYFTKINIDILNLYIMNTIYTFMKEGTGRF